MNVRRNLVRIEIANCNNVRSATFTIEEGRLNVFYAINGTGKSTLARAIESAVRHDADKLKALTPYAFIGDNSQEHKPNVSGVPDDIRIAVFDESYVDQYVFVDNDELIRNSFEIFIKTPAYDQHLDEINHLIANVRSIFDNNPDLDNMLAALAEFISVFGNAKTGISGSGALVKGMSKGNIIQHIPQGLEDYSVFLMNPQNSKWLKWQSTGREYMALGNKCPFCAGELEPRRDVIERINTEYDAKTIEHLSKILDLFERLGFYFAESTKTTVQSITTNVQGLSNEQKNYLVEIKKQVEVLYGKLQQLKRLGFESLKDIDKLAETIPSFKIDIQYLSHLDADYTREKIAIINAAIDKLLEEVGKLQGAVNKQKREIQKTVERYETEINSFLQNAGYQYKVCIEETEEHSYRLLLKFGEGAAKVSGVKSHLSFGERNAFALVLFMYQALSNQADFIILDDPISSFDKNKKFAILDMLFIRGGSFRGKTALLLTHDFEPVIDSIYNHSNFFEGAPVAFFLENTEGELAFHGIEKDDIRSFLQIAEDNIRSSEHIVTKLIYLRRKMEILNGHCEAWHLLSNLLHKRQIPTLGENGPAMAPDTIAMATGRIRIEVSNFDYQSAYSLISDANEMRRLYHASNSYYEKLQIFRLLYDPAGENHVLRKFINETYHVENDYLFQLNPLSFNTIPHYIIAECDRIVAEDEAS